MTEAVVYCTKCCRNVFWPSSYTKSVLNNFDFKLLLNTIATRPYCAAGSRAPHLSSTSDSCQRTIAICTICTRQNSIAGQETDALEGLPKWIDAVCNSVKPLWRKDFSDGTVAIVEIQLLCERFVVMAAEVGISVTHPDRPRHRRRLSTAGLARRRDPHSSRDADRRRSNGPGRGSL